MSDRLLDAAQGSDLSDDPAEKESLNQQIASRMVIGGFTSMTSLSTIGAGLLVNFFA